jgi:CheY-like chemotaxis protein
VKPLSILVVDDNITARKLLKSVLNGSDKRTVIYEASNGVEALKHIKNGLYNIVFLDIEMPGMNGFKVLKEILTEIPDQFVVIVSANATVINVKKTIELGGKGFVAKPYTIKKIKLALNKYLQG